MSVIQTRGLALDLGGITGWAADDPGGSIMPLAGIWDCSHSGDHVGEAYAELEYKLIVAIRRLKPAYVSKEAAVLPRNTSFAAIRKLQGLSATVDLVTWRLDMPVFDVHLQSARRYLTGNGRASKSDVWDACRLKGWPAEDLNQTDALAVLAYARSCYGIHEFLGRTLDRKGRPAA